MPELPLIYDLDFQKISDLINDWSDKSYRADQIWKGLYQHLWSSPGDFTTLSKSLRQRLSDHFHFASLVPEKTISSSDGNTQKTLFRLMDGNYIETVLMNYRSRHTLCVSSQVGCALGCVFCATGQMGFRRDLSSGEIVEQVLYFARLLNSSDQRVTNIVLMGMGEPFLNYDETMNAIYRLNNENGFNFGARRFTISTVGIVPGIDRFTGENSQINLAVSLHAANDELRSSMLPINKKYPIADLLQACRRYVEKTRRRITFEYALIDGVNDEVEHARQLANLLKGLLCHVNLIPLNPTNKYSYKGSSISQVEAFKNILDEYHIPCSIRLRRGIDIQAGCGQLANQEK